MPAAHLNPHLRPSSLIRLLSKAYGKITKPRKTDLIHIFKVLANEIKLGNFNN